MRSSDYKRKITDYFKKNLKKGYPEDSLKWALVKQGYVRVMVEEALKQAKAELAQEAPVVQEKPTIKYEVVEDAPVEPKRSWWKRLFGG